MKNKFGRSLSWTDFYERIEGEIPRYIDGNTVKVQKFVENEENVMHSHVWVSAFVNPKFYPEGSYYFETLFRLDGKCLKPWFDCDLGKEAEAVYQVFKHERLNKNKEKTHEAALHALEEWVGQIFKNDGATLGALLFEQAGITHFRHRGAFVFEGQWPDSTVLLIRTRPVDEDQAFIEVTQVQLKEKE